MPIGPASIPANPSSPGLTSSLLNWWNSLPKPPLPGGVVGAGNAAGSMAPGAGTFGQAAAGSSVLPLLLSILAGGALGTDVGLETSAQMGGEHLHDYNRLGSNPWDVRNLPGAIGNTLIDAERAAGFLGQAPVRLQDTAESFGPTDARRMMLEAINPVAKLGRDFERGYDWAPGTHGVAIETGPAWDKQRGRLAHPTPGSPAALQRAISDRAKDSAKDSPANGSKPAALGQASGKPGTQDDDPSSGSSFFRDFGGEAGDVQSVRREIGHLGRGSQRQRLDEYSNQLRDSDTKYQGEKGSAGHAALLEVIKKQLGVFNK